MRLRAEEADWASDGSITNAGRSIFCGVGKGWGVWGLKSQVSKGGAWVCFNL